MIAVEAIRESLVEEAKDIKLNLQNVLQDGSLSAAQKWGVAAACAVASRSPELRAAVLSEARAAAGEDVVSDARAAAVLMSMNNVYYRFRHLVGNAAYSQKPARLRMNRLVKPATNKIDLELMCLAVSAINGCEACLRAHEKVVLAGGLSEDQVHDAVRIASTVQAAAVALEISRDEATLKAAAE